MTKAAKLLFLAIFGLTAAPTGSIALGAL